ncbi:uncharacterized protein B0I36DRAFT_358402 [Microdochium trichocladiopsis]|uniref:Ankyrin repeat-containing domain protein n=1 Tax=Microdochium trichocladiopsis TaxID=1682393 RepID=A0A9P8YJL4_9PEZI|nr:uncharacterized protein B0I36DRAFT_358402 [Microdochium trichocladiopsis]KAH7041213.1 hypothetical protein B0I36DRAFT_358402 [Microdochium trichocladiopsis]
MTSPAAEHTTRAEKVELFLDLSVLRYSIDPRTAEWSDQEGHPHDSPERWARAARLLAEDPSIARDSIHTAVVAHNVELVREFLAADAASPTTSHAFDGWQPLMRLAYTRLPGLNILSPSGQPAPTISMGSALSTTTSTASAGTYSSPALVIAKLLLEAGADPSGGPLRGDAKGFTALTGVIGGGEADQPSHPHAEALARLLIQYGAEPLDGQALYNTSLVHRRPYRTGDDTASGGIDQAAGTRDDEVFWLNFLWEECKARYMADRSGDTDKTMDTDGMEDAGAHVRERWQAPVANGTLPAPPLEYLLRSAISQHQPKRVEWLLEHSADAGTSITPSVGQTGTTNEDD